MKTFMGSFTLIFLLFGQASIFAQNPPILNEFSTGLNQPTYITHANDYRLFVVEKRGTIRSIDTMGIYNGFFLDIRDRVRSSGGEQGLLGLAFHPDFQENGRLFVNYTNSQGNTIVSRFEVNEQDETVADPDSELIMMEIEQPFTNHNGGQLLFGPDGYLYIFLGDGGAGGDPMNLSQDPLSLLGKILRVDVDGAEPYRIPPDNPFFGSDFELEEIWALGLRNPWRNSFDRQTGDLWIADVGQNEIEEINFQSSSSSGGENYGWRCYEGSQAFNLSGDCNGPFEFPIFEYSSGGATGCSVTGGYVYRGEDVPYLNGKYIFGDFCTGFIWAMEYDSTAMEYDIEEIFHIFGGQLASFGEDIKGELYVTHFNQGRISKITDVCGDFDWSMDIQPESCPNAEDAEINVVLSGGTAPYQISWSDGVTDEFTRIGLSCGTGSFTVEDQNECTITVQYEIDCPRDLFPDFIQSGDSLISTEAGVIYSWYLNGDLIKESEDPYIIIVESGTYLLKVADDENCIFSSDPKEIVLSNLGFILDVKSVVVFPNPTQSSVSLEKSSVEWNRLVIYNSIGQKVSELEINTQEQIDLSHLHEGWHLLIFENTAGEKGRSTLYKGTY